MAVRSASPAALQILQEIGVIDLPEDWEIIRIEDLLSNDRGIAVGVMYPGSHDPAGIPLIKAGDLTGSRINPNPEFRVTPEKHREYRRTELAGGELLISLVGNVGRCALVPRLMSGWNAARAIAVLRFERPADAAFVRACLMSSPLQHLMHAWSTTTVQATLNLKEIRQIPLPWPPKKERNAIAHILGTLDDKIELNRRMSETLEAMARTLFKSWFVDFDPVRAKMAGRDPGLPKHIADLFPDRLVDSELGEIPEGWEVCAFGDVVEQLRDSEKPLASPSVHFRHFSIPAFDNGQSPKQELGECIKSQKSRVPPGAVLLSKLNPEIERVWLVDVKPDDRAVCSTEFLVFRPRPPFARSYAYCLARSPVFRQELEGLVTGTSKSHQRAQPASILALHAVMPPDSLAVGFEHIAGPLLQRTLKCRSESLTLAALRGTLLPRLISGELRLTRTSQFLESA